MPEVQTGKRAGAQIPREHFEIPVNRMIRPGDPESRFPNLEGGPRMTGPHPGTARRAPAASNARPAMASARHPHQEGWEPVSNDPRRPAGPPRMRKNPGRMQTVMPGARTGRILPFRKTGLEAGKRGRRMK